VNFKPPQLYPRKKGSKYPLDRRLGGPQSRSRRSDEEKKSMTAPAGNRAPLVEPVT